MDGVQFLCLAEVTGGVADGKLDVVLEPATVCDRFLDGSNLVFRNFPWITGTVSAHTGTSPESQAPCQRIANMLVSQCGEDWRTGVTVIVEDNLPAVSLVSGRDHLVREGEAFDSDGMRCLVGATGQRQITRSDTMSQQVGGTPCRCVAIRHRPLLSSTP